MKWGLILLLALYLAVRAHGDGGEVTLDFPNTDVRAVLMFYERLTDRPVLVKIDLRAWVSVVSDGRITREKAIALIRQKLLETYGIEMRDSDRGETLVTWSQDSKYAHRSERPDTETDRWLLRKNGIEIIQAVGGK